MVTLVALETPRRGAPQLEVALVVGPPAGTPRAPQPVARTPAEQVALDAWLAQPGPGEAVLVVTLVNDAPRPVDARWLHDLRPTLTDAKGAPIDIPDVRALERPPHPPPAGPPPDLVEPGQRREVVRWQLTPRAGRMELSVPYGGDLPLAGTVVLTAQTRFAVTDSLEAYTRRVAWFLSESGQDKATAQAHAEAGAARFRDAYARLGDTWQGEVVSPRYRLELS